MTNKIFKNKKTFAEVELVSITAEGRYIVMLDDGTQKSYSESSFKKMFKAVETAEAKAEEAATEEPATEETPAETETTEESEAEAPKAEEQKTKNQKPSKQLTAEEKEKILDKIKKLFALAGNNPSEQEAQAAMTKAQKLMAEYSISMSEGSEVKYEYTALACKHYHNLGYRVPLSQIIAKSFRCKVMLNGNVIYMFGRKEDAQAAVECFNFCYAWIHRNGDRLVVEAREKTGTGKGVFHSYVVGVLKGITVSLEEGCTALAIVVPQDVNDSFKETYKDCKTVKRGMRTDSIDYDLYCRGVEDGKTLLNRRSLEVTL